MRDWKMTTIAECSTILGDGLHGTPKYDENGEYAFINGNNLHNGRIVIKPDTKRVGLSEYEKHKKELTDRTVLVSINGTLGNVAVYNGEKVILGKSACYFNVSSDCDVQFMRYVASSPCFQQYINSVATGTTIKNVSLKQMREYSFLIPELEEQQRIAKVLHLLDQKIENNQKINDNLARQAQAILSHYMETYAFDLRPLSEIADVIDCLHSKKPNRVDDSEYQLIQLDNIRDDGFLDLAACKYMISKCDYDNWTRKCEIVEGDCVITNVGRIGAVSQAPFGTHAAMGRNMTCIRLKADCNLQYYFITVLLSQHMRMQIRSNTDEGTIMGALNVKNIPKLLFPIFGDQTMRELEETLLPIRKQIEYLNLMNQNLSAMRDALLPKLISGEIDVSAIDI